MGGYIDDAEGYQPVDKPKRTTWWKTILFTLGYMIPLFWLWSSTDFPDSLGIQIKFHGKGAMLEEWYYSYLLLQRHHILDVITFVYMWSVVAALIGWLALKQLRNTKLSLYSGVERVRPEVLQAGPSRRDRAASPNLTRSELILIALSIVVVLLGLSWALGFDPTKFSRVVDTSEHTIRNRCFNEQGTYAQEDVNVACKQLVEDSTLALRNHRDDADAYFDRGFAYEHAGDLNRAVADFSQVVRLTPSRSQAYYFRWAAYKDLGFKEQADADFTTLKALNPAFAAEIHNNH